MPQIFDTALRSNKIEYVIIALQTQNVGVIIYTIDSNDVPS